MIYIINPSSIIKFYVVCSVSLFQNHFNKRVYIFLSSCLIICWRFIFNGTVSWSKDIFIFEVFYVTNCQISLQKVIPIHELPLWLNSKESCTNSHKSGFSPHSHQYRLCWCYLLFFILIWLLRFFFENLHLIDC